ncbi:hypothetical protein AQ436_00260 [Arthrobacter sp. EpRS66]|nr:hypothetical protein AQ436_00260 [Arthrobacter sp. EpRS66]
MSEDLEALRKIAESATPGPWTAETHCSYTDDKYHAVYSVDAGDSPVISQLGCGCCDVGLEVSKHDIAFVTAFNPETVLALLSRLEQAELDRVKLRNRLDAMRRQRDGYRNQLRKTEQQVARVREVLSDWDTDEDSKGLHFDVERALDGDTRG